MKKVIRNYLLRLMELDWVESYIRTTADKVYREHSSRLEALEAKAKPKKPRMS